MLKLLVILAVVKYNMLVFTKCQVYPSGPPRVLVPHRVLGPPRIQVPYRVLGPHRVLVTRGPGSSQGLGSRFFWYAQIYQLYLSYNEAFCHHICVHDTHFYLIQYKNLWK